MKVVNKEEEITYMKEYNNKINNNKEIFNKIISSFADQFLFSLFIISLYI